MLVNPWVPHANSRAAWGPSTTILALYLEASWLRGVEDGRPMHRHCFAAPSAAVTAKVRQLVATLTATLTQPEPVSGDAAEALLCDLFRAILAAYGGGLQLPAAATFVDARIRRAIAAMRAAAGTSGGIDVETICREVGLSRSRFYEQFRASVGISPGLYADGLLLEHAIEALLSTRQPVGTIALDLGFAAQGHFSRFFKAKVGFSPSEYRRGVSTLN